MRKIAVPIVLLVLASFFLSAFTPVSAPSLISDGPPEVAPPILPVYSCDNTIVAYSSVTEPLIWSSHRIMSYVDANGVTVYPPQVQGDVYEFPHPVPFVTWKLPVGAHSPVMSWHPGTSSDGDVFKYTIPNPDCASDDGVDHGGEYWNGMVGFVNPDYPGYVCFILYDASQGYLPSINDPRLIYKCDNMWPDGAHLGWTAGAHILKGAIGALYNDGWWPGDAAVKGYTATHVSPRLPLFADGDEDLDFVLCRNFGYCVK